MRRVEQLRLDGGADPYPGCSAPDMLTAQAEMARLQAAGYSCHLIASSLNRQGIPAPRGGAWHRSTVLHTLNAESWAAYMRDYRRKHGNGR
jgi:hypothetical protein